MPAIRARRLLDTKNVMGLLFKPCRLAANEVSYIAQKRLHDASSCFICARTEGECPEPRENLAVGEPLEILGLAATWIDHVGTLRAPDRVAIGVHLQKVGSLRRSSLSQRLPLFVNLLICIRTK